MLVDGLIHANTQKRERTIYICPYLSIFLVLNFYVEHKFALGIKINSSYSTTAIQRFFLDVSKQMLCEFRLVWISRMKYPYNDAELMRQWVHSHKCKRRKWILPIQSLFRIHNELARSGRDYIIALVWLKSLICLANLVKLFARNFPEYCYPLWKFG